MVIRLFAQKVGELDAKKAKERAKEEREDES